MQLKQLADLLDQNRHENGQEYWLARDLYQLLGYKKWQNFLTALNRAQESCKASGYAISNHFTGVSKMVSIGLGSQRSVDDFKLSRYACYLIAQK